MNRTAPSSGDPTRERALLIAEPRPENRVGIEPMSVEVSGATTSEMPTPKSRIDGRTSMNTSSGGTNVDGSLIAIFQGADVAGSRAYQTSPAAMSSGPAVRNRRA